MVSRLPQWYRPTSLRRELRLSRPWRRQRTSKLLVLPWLTVRLVFHCPRCWRNTPTTSLHTRTSMHSERSDGGQGRCEWGSSARVVDQQGHELFVGGQRTVVADQAAHPGCDAGLHDGEVGAGGDDEVPDTVADLRRDDRAEPSCGDGFIAGADPRSIPDQLTPGRAHIVGGARLGVDVPGARVTAQHAHPSLQRRLGVEVE